MAAATVVSTEYGYRCHTGTETATVTANRTAVRAFIYTPVGSNKTLTITNGKDAAVTTIWGATAHAPVTLQFFGKYLDGIKIQSNGDFSLMVLVA